MDATYDDSFIIRQETQSVQGEHHTSLSCVNIDI